MSPFQGSFEDDFLFPRWDMLIPWRVIFQHKVLQPWCAGIICQHGELDQQKQRSTTGRAQQEHRRAEFGRYLSLLSWLAVTADGRNPAPPGMYKTL